MNQIEQRIFSRFSETVRSAGLSLEITKQEVENADRPADRTEIIKGEDYMQFPALETERLLLVKVEQQHLDRYYEIMSQDKVMKYYGMEPLQSAEEASQLIHSFGLLFEAGRGIRWGIILQETDEFIGTIGLNNLYLAGKKAEVGYELHPAYWRRGIMKEALQAVLRYSFDELDLFRIGAVTFPENPPSFKLLKKIGFTEEGRLRGYLRQRNEQHDALVFSILKDEWSH